MCGSAFAESRELHIVVDQLKAATNDSLAIAVPTGETVYTKTKENKSSAQSGYIYKAASDGTVDITATRQYSPDGTIWVDGSAIFTASNTTATKITSSTLEPYNKTRLKLVAGAGGHAGTTIQIWEGKK